MGRPRKQWSRATVERLITMRRAGASWREIGAAIGKPHVTCARYWVEVLGMDRFRVGREQ
ncbi:hypothetical protein GOB93_07615 [Acetobacter musti]|uniref:Transposase n=1 Tax=Acetobacter musti TaxID=864732 RepID=A0ABX0JLZ1_9PROT|nr:hypothetical protein [Acetobacter musti]NHN84511.1 hypothetical protein [Acetobacter musti]